MRLQSLGLIKEFTRQIDVVLSSHDVNTPRLLADRAVYMCNQDKYIYIVKQEPVNFLLWFNLPVPG